MSENVPQLIFAENSLPVFFTEISSLLQKKGVAVEEI